jgi:ORF6N domain
MLDSDLAELYGVTSRRLAEQVRRNPDRFPPDFMFRLTTKERDSLLAIRPDLERIGFSRVMPRAFTEHGALMLANVLNSDVAVQVSIEIVRTFVKIREAVATHAALAQRIDTLELKYDGQFKGVFDAIRGLMRPVGGAGRKIGFTP